MTASAPVKAPVKNKNNKSTAPARSDTASTRSNRSETTASARSNRSESASPACSDRSETTASAQSKDGHPVLVFPVFRYKRPDRKDRSPLLTYDRHMIDV